MKRLNISLLIAAITLSVTACGGGGSSGGSSSSLPPTGGGGGSSTQSAIASMTIKIPARAASAKSQYVSAGTQSITIGLVASGKTTQIAEIDLTPTSRGCSAIAGGGSQCTVTFAGSAGANVFALNMYDQTGGKGNVLSTGNVSATLVAGQTTNIAIALNGVVASVSAALNPSTLPVGYANSVVAVVEARDAQNNIIVGPDGFSSPITLTIGNDPYHTLSLTTTPAGSGGMPQTAAQSVTVTAPGQLVTLNYNGGTNVASTVTPSINGTNGTAATFAGSGAMNTEIATTLAAPF